MFCSSNVSISMVLSIAPSLLAKTHRQNSMIQAKDALRGVRLAAKQATCHGQKMGRMVIPPS